MVAKIKASMANASIAFGSGSFCMIAFGNINVINASAIFAQPSVAVPINCSGSQFKKTVDTELKIHTMAVH